MFIFLKKWKLFVCGGNMEIKEDNKVKKFFRRYGVLSLACVFSLAIALTIAFSVPKAGVDVSTDGIKFGLPMENAVVVKDFDDSKLQLNDSLERWEIHLSVDLASENNKVFSVYDGVVSSVESNSLDGYCITIEHADGFVSVYSSLAEEVKVKEGDKVTKGQEIGQASDTATNESKDGQHLHFTLLKDGNEVDPNNYLDLQNK